MTPSPTTKACTDATFFEQVGKAVSKDFPGWGTFSGSIVLYAPKTDTFKIVYEGVL